MSADPTIATVGFRQIGKNASYSRKDVITETCRRGNPRHHFLPPRCEHSFALVCLPDSRPAASCQWQAQTMHNGHFILRRPSGKEVVGLLVILCAACDRDATHHYKLTVEVRGSEQAHETFALSSVGLVAADRLTFSNNTFIRRFTAEGDWGDVNLRRYAISSSRTPTEVVSALEIRGYQCDYAVAAGRMPLGTLVEELQQLALLDDGRLTRTSDLDRSLFVSCESSTGGSGSGAAQFSSSYLACSDDLSSADIALELLSSRLDRPSWCSAVHLSSSKRKQLGISLAFASDQGVRTVSVNVCLDPASFVAPSAMPATATVGCPATTMLMNPGVAPNPGEECPAESGELRILTFDYRDGGSVGGSMDVSFACRSERVRAHGNFVLPLTRAEKSE